MKEKTTATSCENASAHYQKRIMELELQLLQSGNFYYDSLQLMELRSIANMCPYTEGTGVYQARSILSAYDPYGTEYLNPCEISEENERLIINANEETINGDINLYPNPANDNITIEFTIETAGLITISNMLGEQVYVGNATEGEQKININISNFTEGVYLCKLIDAENKSQTIKFNVIKQ